MPWDLMAWGFTKAKDLAWTLKTPVQLMQEAAVVLMQGGNHHPWLREYIGALVKELFPKPAVTVSKARLMWTSRSVGGNKKDTDSVHGGVGGGEGLFLTAAAI